MHYIVVPSGKPTASHKESNGERDVPVTHVGNLLVCKCVCNISLLKVEIDLRNVHGKERVRRRTSDFVYAPDNGWVLLV